MQVAEYSVSAVVALWLMLRMLLRMLVRDDCSPKRPGQEASGRPPLQLVVTEHLAALHSGK